MCTKQEITYLESQVSILVLDWRAILSDKVNRTDVLIDDFEIIDI